MQNPYEMYHTSDAWRIIKKALQDLKDNQDIEIMTSDNYVIGYIVKALIENNIDKKRLPT